MQFLNAVESHITGQAGRSGSSLKRGLLVVLGLTLGASAFGCRTEKADKKANQTASVSGLVDPGRTTLTGERLIAPLPFGERNGKDEFNASGAVALGENRFLFCDNNTGDALFELNLMPEGQQQRPIQRRPLQGLTPAAIDDLEGLTLAETGGRRYIFAASSLYAKKGKKKDPLTVPPSGLLRIAINADDSLQAENMPGFRAWLLQQVPELASAAALEPDDGGLNVEGLAWDEKRQALLLGVRTPVPQGKPLLIPVKIKNLTGPWTPDNLEVLPLIRLTLPAYEGEQGVRSIEYIAARSTFMLVLGKTGDNSDAPFTLYEWDGQDAGAVKRLPYSFTKKMKPEGLAGGMVGGKAVLLISDDGGGFQVLPLEIAQG